MDRELSPQFIVARRRKRIIIATAFFVLLLAGLLGFRTLLKTTVSRDLLRIAVADRGPVEETIAATGLVSPEYELDLTSPVQTKIDSIFFHAGDKVNEGQSIVRLNKDMILSSYDNLKDEQGANQNKITKVQWTQEKNVLDLRTQYDIKQLNVRSMASTLESEKKLQEIGGSTMENVARAELNLKTAQLELTQLDNQIKNQQKSMLTDIKDLSYDISIQDKKIGDMKKKIEQADITAPRAGVVTWVNEKMGSVINEGEVIAKLADLNTFRVEGSISDTYADKLMPGGAVIVKVNDRNSIRGKISGIKPKVENGVVNFTIILDEKNNRILRPSLKVDVFLVASFRDNVVRVKNGPVFSDKGDQYVFVVQGNKAVKRKITVGVSNFDFVEIKEGIHPGEQVIISDVTDYNHLDGFNVQ